MRKQTYWHTPHPLDMTEENDAARISEDYVWSNSEKSKARATSLFIIQSIV